MQEGFKMIFPEGEAIAFDYLSRLVGGEVDTDEGVRIDVTVSPSPCADTIASLTNGAGVALVDGPTGRWRVALSGAQSAALTIGVAYHVEIWKGFGTPDARRQWWGYVERQDAAPPTA